MDRTDKIVMRACAVAFVALAGLMAYEQAHAVSGDHWGEEHVKQHFQGELALGVAAGYFIQSKPLAFAAAITPGLLREEWKRQNGYASYKPSRLVADSIGAALGVYLGNCVIRDRSVTCKLEF